MTAEVYGQGISSPMRLGIAGIRESAGVQRVEESIRVILGTQHGERIMRPQFGCNLKSLAFAPNNPATASLARYYVEDGLARWEPRIDVVTVTVDNDRIDGVLRITVTYRLRATQQAHTLVFPFSLERRQ